MSVRMIDIKAGKTIAMLNEKTAQELGLFPLDRVRISHKDLREIHAPVDITDSMVKKNEIGLFKDVAQFLKIKKKSIVTVSTCPKPKSVLSIKKKLDAKKLSFEEIKEIVTDISSNHLSEIELAAFMSAVYINGFDLDETVSMTKALIEDGERIEFEEKIIVDKHSVGGTNGRTTMVVVPIMAAAGYLMPKTSSRTITSATGTADSMEVLAPVDLTLQQIKNATKKAGGVIAWGGAVNLAPADDKIIKIEHPLSLDPQGQVIASVMAKKASVGAKFVVIDIPVGPDVKIKTKETAQDLALKFLEVGKELGIKVEVVLTDGSKPIGNTFGPSLEAKLALQVLEGKVFDELAKKSLELTGSLLELVGHCKQGKGYEVAKQILESKAALKKMQEIIRAQGGNILTSEQIKEAKLKRMFYSDTAGLVKRINVKNCIAISRNAGAPADKEAGLILSTSAGEMIKQGQPVFEIHSNNKEKMSAALRFAARNPPVELEKTVIEKFH